MTESGITLSEPGMNPVGLTLAELLHVSAADIGTTLADHINQQSAQGAMSSSIAQVLAEEAAALISSKLGMDVFELTFKAWAAVRELRDYADPVKHPPGETAVLRWGKCSISAPQGIDVKLKVAGLDIVALRLTVELEAEFHSLALVVRDGAIQKVSPGPASASAALSYGKVPLISKCKTPELTFDRGIEFHPGLKIGWSPREVAAG